MESNQLRGHVGAAPHPVYFWGTADNRNAKIYILIYIIKRRMLRFFCVFMFIYDFKVHATCKISSTNPDRYFVLFNGLKSFSSNNRF